MRRLAQKKARKPISKGHKIALAIAFGLAAFIGVFIVLMLTNERKCYIEAHGNAVEILSTRDAVVGFLDKKPESLDFSEEEKQLIEKFDTSLTKCKDYMTSLSISNTLKNQEVDSVYAGAKEKYAAIEKLASVWTDVKKMMDLTDENLEALQSSQNETIKRIAEELGQYRKDVADFKAKYGDNKEKSNELIEAYGKIQVRGDELNKKYNALTLDDLLGMSRDDILSFYAKIEELKSILAKKI